MATRSAIGIKHGNRIKAIYCHWDGYIEHTGAVLNVYYQDSIKVNKLISMGDLSSIGAVIGEEHDFDENKEYLPDGAAEQCTFYTRDRGEDAAFKSFKNETAFVEHYDRCGCEFFYLYDHGVWYVSARGRVFNPLHELLSKETA
jgi:hypothetical protein